ncbi:MAG: hypothetical protein LUC34_01660 [Campylobacter sp.]|nr:hypothetical protein [Campylobacter sp.]
MNTQIKDALQNVKVALEQLGDELKKNADERKDCVVEQVKNSLLNLSEKIKGETAAANAKALSDITEFSDKFTTGA